MSLMNTQYDSIMRMYAARQARSRQEYEARMEQMVKELESAPLAKNAQKIFVPGEMEWAKREKALAENRLELADNMAENLEKAAALTKTSLHWLAD